MGKKTEAEALEALGPPPELPRRRGSELLSGLDLIPEDRLRAFGPDQLELVVGHWLHEAHAGKYARVLRVAGPGDKGRDVVAYEDSDANDPWDNYQCKQYATKLGPEDIRVEGAKLVYYTSRGDYSVPRTYYFVAPLGFTTKALELINDSEALRKDLLETWDKHSKSLCELPEIADDLTGFVFPEFVSVGDTDIVQDLKDCPIYPVFFGGGLTKPRPPDQIPPELIGEHELPYINCLVEAYDEHSETSIETSDDALTHEKYGEHLRFSRRDFYCAESLREFSKDVLPEREAFDQLQDQIYDGIKYTVSRDFPTGYERVIGVCEHATSVQITAHPLREDLRPGDRSGICHQLANDGRVVWKKP